MKTARAILVSLSMVSMFSYVHGGGTLMPVDSGLQPLTMQSHHVQVTINNGFAMTRVTQTFHNPNGVSLEGMYAFPVPESASLAEMTATIGETVIRGEVMAKQEARRVYREERDDGNKAGLAEKDGYRRFEFTVANIPPTGIAQVSFAYYQSLRIDTGIGKYVYPLEEGGTDVPAAESFWLRNEKVDGLLELDIELKSAWPVVDVRLPGFGGAPRVVKLADGHYQLHAEKLDASLDKDVVFYYRLADNLPGRIEVIPYRADASKPGTFMMVVTPGIDLKPLTNGADYVFVLDTSGSMSGKINTLATGVSKTLGTMSPNDRYKIVLFSTDARVMVDWQQATPSNVNGSIEEIKRLKVGGSTNMFAGLKQALRVLDADRATSIVLVTDGVTNTGVVAPAAFDKLMRAVDVRVFGFLMGNSANWPLMRTVCDASGGFYAGVSNNDDIIGQIMLAKSKVTHECLHDAEIRVKGVKTFDVNDGWVGKIYRGQQLVLLGRYEAGGQARVELSARLTGEDRIYSTTFDFPEIDTDNPELERMWALSRVEDIEQLRMLGLIDDAESKVAVRDLGVQYQIVTDETSMAVLTDRAFQRHGVERHNLKRTQVEHAAQTRKAAQAATNYRVDRQQPAFKRRAHHVGGGGGAIDPISALLAAMLGLGALRALQKDRG